MCCVETHVRSPPAGPYGQISVRTSCKPPKAFPKRLEPKIESRKGELNSPIRAEFFRRSREKQAVGFVSIPISVDTRATPNIPRETRRAMAQTSRSIAPGTKRAMRDVTNAVSPRDIAPKPRASDLILWPIFSLYKCEDYLASCMSIVATYARSTLESIIRGIIIVIYVSQLAGVITLWQLRKTPKFLRSEIRTVASTPSNQLFLFMVK